MPIFRGLEFGDEDGLTPDARHAAPLCRRHQLNAAEENEKRCRYSTRGLLLPQPEMRNAGRFPDETD